MENRYDKYKDSGIAWIGEIPEHWEVKRMKSIYNFGKGLNITKADLVDKGIPVISYGQIHSKLNIGTCIKDSLIRYVPKVFLENNNTSLVKKGDVIFADTSEDLEGCGNCIYIDRDMLLYAGYHTIIAKNISTSYNRYFSYLFQTDCWRSQIRRLVNGVKLFSIPQKLLASTDVITPSTQEQQSISTYLDQKCGKIDELITLQEEMITKLQSYKQSVITEAVTKGLDKNVPLKDSGIEWIGEIPKHWEVRRMKSIYNFGKGLSITKADLVDKGIPVISYGQIHSKLNIGTCIKDSLIRYVPKVFLENNNTSLVKKGDVIFADTSEDLEGCGNCIYIDRDMLLYAGYHTIIAKNISTSYNRYFSYLFQTDCWRFQIRRMVNGVKLFSIPQKLLASADLIVPSTQEQQSIADYLDQRCSEIDELISIKQQKIEKLKEYKKSLIFECVTGKRKVS